ncbi:hypothetical protein [Staphylothermus hellenicus]|uniref:Serine protease-like protein n=1 Tax=Staphylothermus hellenicus (strain DSM 12710 / JCM 10830 / BK20S6-10-b1 / P8) TaxID=591019 RepID=D7D8Y7_STAHD|nr:hypothetical protein [Staphylothermus hellenicus]ADI32233.1 serine protease-like protein [Staphylothermus hellenicus DSM 12710]
MKINNTIKIVASVFLLLLILSQTSIIADSASKYLVSSTNIYLLAVTNSNMGIVVNVTLQAYFPGEGKIEIIEKNGVVEEDTLYSIYYSLRLASLVTGIDYRSYDYKIIFPEEIYMKGTSATLAFTLGFIGLLKNIRHSPKVGATGVVAPDLIVGNVSGIDAKYYAALRYGLDYVIGPPQFFRHGFRYSSGKYIYAIDVFNAYNYYSGNSILPSIHVMGKPFIKYLVNAFNYSYINLKKSIDQYLQRQGLNISSINGSTYYFLANKYYSIGDYYTAASYMFRAYINIYTSILARKALRDPRITALLMEWVQHNLTKTKDLIRNYETLFLNKDYNIWNFDVFLNAYIRYSQSKYYYYAGNNITSPTQKTEYYVLSLARIQTVKHWLKLFINKSDPDFLDNVNNNYDRIIDYINISLIYLKSMNYIGNQTVKYFKSIVNSNQSSLEKTLYLGYYFYTLNQNLSAMRGLFDLFISPKTVIDLNKTINGLGYLIGLETGYLTPTMLTTVELVNDYLVEGEKTYNLGMLMSMNLAILVFELMITRQYMRLSAEKIAYTQIVSSHELRYDVLPAIIALIIGSFLIGYLIGRIKSKPFTLENQVWSYT